MRGIITPAGAAILTLTPNRLVSRPDFLLYRATISLFDAGGRIALPTCWLWANRATTALSR